MVREGGGVQASVEAEFLDGKEHKCSEIPFLFRLALKVVKITEQMPEALGPIADEHCDKFQCA